ncbi:bacteriorhodopsin [Haloarcula sp. K1]|uniref:bacteriorhodopsin n=1 Tax=Haloarcula sp. K1 TaxID=1622207 RepID=UPI0007BB2171|nr:bacteriorhodopsin [Haloarcula sp. K1]KZX49790.1 rhodopsin [Haloarcula sp. K1]
MISGSAVYEIAAVLLAVAAVVLSGWLRRIPSSHRHYCYPVVAVVGISAVTTALTAAGVLSVPGSQLTVPNIVDDFVAYTVLWTLTVAIAGASRRTLAVAAAIPAVQVIAFNGGTIVGGAIGLVGFGVLVIGQLLLAYLLLGPVWRRAADLPDDQRLLHWKSRNLLLFLIGMLIAYSLLAVADVFDPFVLTVISEYMGLLIRVGFAGFLFANVDAIAVDRTGFADVASESAGAQRAG